MPARDIVYNPSPYLYQLPGRCSTKTALPLNASIGGGRLAQLRDHATDVLPRKPGDIQ